jgi:cell division septum initiation protein DivIVA
MGMVAPVQRIASAFYVLHGRYGDVSCFARERGVCRQWIYREADRVRLTLDCQPWRLENGQLRQRIAALDKQVQQLQQRLNQAVILDGAKQAEVAIVCQAVGISLPHCRTILEVLTPGKILSVPTLGRRSQAAAKKAGELLPVLDELTRERVQQAAVDEIYVKDPVLMVVEPESLCWVSGRLSDEVSGSVWAGEFAQLPHLNQVMRDGSSCLAKGVALVNEQRQEQGRTPMVDQGDHYHALRGSGVGFRKLEAAARRALEKVEAAEQELAEYRYEGLKQTGPAVRLQAAWKQLEAAMDRWTGVERAWRQTKGALQLVTGQGELNSRAQAEAVLAESLPQLPEDGFSKIKRLVQKPEMLNYLDLVQRRVDALPFEAEIKQAAVEQECLRRRPDLLRGAETDAAVLRGVLLTCGVILSAAGVQGEQAVAAVRDIFRRAYRASSFVECINSVLRMQQASHRKMTQGLLDLKRLYWNCHTFRTGRRRGTTPYQRLGVPWPNGLHWWEMLKLTPEQLRDKLSTAKKAG